MRIRQDKQQHRSDKEHDVARRAGKIIPAANSYDKKWERGTLTVMERKQQWNTIDALKTVTTIILSNAGWFKGAVFVAFCIIVSPFWVEAKPLDKGEQFVKSQCVGCHRIEGAPMSRSSKKAPDLIWAGNKYQRTWLVDWLQHPKQKLYPVGYDFNFTRKGPHVSITQAEAEHVADFLSTLQDKRVTVGVMKPGTPEELAQGKQLYPRHGCQNCHRMPANNKRGYKGGTSSASFVNMGNRLKGDWVYRFNLNPNDFVPESGAYIPKPLLPDSDIYAITAYMMTFGK